MAKVSNLPRGRRGLPPARKTIAVVVPAEMLEALDQWIVEQPKALLSRPEAIRQLIARGTMDA